MGLQVEIYRSTTTVDCTNGGMSSRQGVRGFTLTNVEGPSQPSPIYPAAKLKKGAFNSLHIKPAWNEDEHTMDGGNFAASSDSRFSQACRELLGHHFYGAVAIHDRVENF
tara:strand:- start:107 stop:436 length:330 start_codon:yes stop_codon:yes gene_type:complete